MTLSGHVGSNPTPGVVFQEFRINCGDKMPMVADEKPTDVKYLFEPKSVAVVGASDDENKFGYFLMKNLINFGYDGKIFPVNKKRETVLGLKCYPTVDSIPDEVEAAITLIPAKFIPQVMKDCAQKGVKGIIVCTSGFRETGEEGIKLEKEIIDIAEKAGIRIVGPNTTGILNAINGFTSTFVILPQPRKGSVSFIAQSGMFASVMLEYMLTTQPFGFSKLAGLGNKVDVDDADILEYLNQDNNTKVIAVYMEGVSDGRKFYQVAKKIAAKKPIVILKSASSKSGGEASLTHTGSLMVKDEIFDALCRSTGLIRVEDLEELIDLTKAFALCPLPKGKKIGIIAYTGGGCVMSSDACERYGLELAKFSNSTMSKLTEHAPSFAIIRNPIDAELIRQGVGDMNASLELSLEAVANDENVDAISVVLVGLSSTKTIWDIDIKRIFAKIREEHPEKPIVATTLAGRELIEEHKKKFDELGIPFFPSLLRNIRALAALVKYSKIKFGKI